MKYFNHDNLEAINIILLVILTAVVICIGMYFITGQGVSDEIIYLMICISIINAIVSITRLRMAHKEDRNKMERDIQKTEMLIHSNKWCWENFDSMRKEVDHIYVCNEIPNMQNEALYFRGEESILIITFENKHIGFSFIIINFVNGKKASRTFEKKLHDLNPQVLLKAYYSARLQCSDMPIEIDLSNYSINEIVRRLI